MPSKGARFTWTDQQRASVVRGATVVIYSRSTQPTRYQILAVKDDYIAFRDASEGTGVAPYYLCDPATLLLPPDPRQLDMFAGRK